MIGTLNEISVYEILKTHNKHRDNSYTKNIEEKDLAYNNLKQICNFKREIVIGSDYFNKILNKEIARLKLKLKISLLKGFPKMEKKIRKKLKKLINFAKKNIGYFDLAELDFEELNSYLVSENSESNKISKLKESSIIEEQPSFRMNKEFMINSSEMNNNTPTSLNSNFFNRSSGRRNIFEQLGNRVRRPQNEEVERSENMGEGNNMEHIPEENEAGITGSQNINSGQNMIEEEQVEEEEREGPSESNLNLNINQEGVGNDEGVRSQENTNIFLNPRINNQNANEDNNNADQNEQENGNENNQIEQDNQGMHQGEIQNAIEQIVNEMEEARQSSI